MDPTTGKFLCLKFYSPQFLGRWVACGKVGPDQTTALVDGLSPGHEYKFRVSAVNSEGESAPLETLEKIVAKEPWDPPGKPENAKVTDYDKVSV